MCLIDRKRLKDGGFIPKTVKSTAEVLCFRKKISRKLSFKIAEYPLHQLLRLGRQEIHIALSQSQHRCQNPCSGIMCCHRQSILTLNLTLNNKTKSRAHQMEPPSPIQALGVNLFPSRFIIRTVPRGDFAHRR